MWSFYQFELRAHFTLRTRNIVLVLVGNVVEKCSGINFGRNATAHFIALNWVARLERLLACFMLGIYSLVHELSSPTVFALQIQRVRHVTLDFFLIGSVCNPFYCNPKKYMLLEFFSIPSFFL